MPSMPWTLRVEHRLGGYAVHRTRTSVAVARKLVVLMRWLWVTGECTTRTKARSKGRPIRRLGLSSTRMLEISTRTHNEDS
jgi:hypothetical protein